MKKYTFKGYVFEGFDCCGGCHDFTVEADVELTDKEVKQIISFYKKQEDTDALRLYEKHSELYDKTCHVLWGKVIDHFMVEDYFNHYLDLEEQQEHRYKEDLASGAFVPKELYPEEDFEDDDLIYFDEWLDWENANVEKGGCEYLKSRYDIDVSLEGVEMECNIPQELLEETFDS